MSFLTFSLPPLPRPRTHRHINTINLILLKRALRDPLLSRLRVRRAESNLLGPVNDEMLHLMHADVGDEFYTVSFSDLSKSSGDHGVGVTGLDKSGGDLHSVVACLGDVAHFGGGEDGGGVFGGGDDDGVGGTGYVAVDVAAEVDLDDVSGEQCGGGVGFRLEGGEVTDALVDREADGEGNALLNILAVFLLVVDLGKGFIDDALSDNDQIEDGSPGDDVGDEGGEGEVGDTGGLEVFGDDLCV